MTALRAGADAAGVLEDPDTVTRELAHEPLGWRPTTPLVTIRRYPCTGCEPVWRQDTSRAAEPRARLSSSTTIGASASPEDTVHFEEPQKWVPGI